MTAVWLFSFFLMWKERRCHRWLPRELLRSVWAHDTDFPLELEEEEQEEQEGEEEEQEGEEEDQSESRKKEINQFKC